MFLRQLAALLADGAALLVYAGLSHVLLERFQQKTPGNAVVIGLLYLVFCLSVYVLLRLPSADHSGPREPGGFAFFSAWCFAVLVPAMMAGSSGLFDQFLADHADATSVSTGLLVMVGVLAVLLFVALYPAAFWAGKAAEPLRETAGTPWLEFAALLGINLMIVLTAVQWEVTFANTEPYTDLTWRAKALIFGVVYVTFLIFLAAPRLVFLVRKPGWIAAATFLLETGWFVWRSLAGKAWQ